MSQSDNKQMDGIKKPTSEDVKKSRQIVLDLIGEKSVSSAPAAGVLPPKNLDGIRAGLVSAPKPIDKALEAKNEEKRIEQKNLWQKEMAGVFGGAKPAIKPSMAEIIPPRPKAVPPIAPEKQEFAPKPDPRIKAALEEAKRAAEKKAAAKAMAEEKAEIMKKEAEQREMDTRRKALEMTKNKEVKKEKEKDDSRALEAEKKAAEAALAEKKRRKAEQKKRFYDYSKKIKQWKNGVADNCRYWLLKIKKAIKYSWKNALFAFALSLLSVLLFYLLFIIVVINFNLDNFATRFLAGYLPVPAFVSGDGIIEYYDYRDAMAAQSDESRPNLIRQLIVSNLMGKYDLSMDDFADFSRLEEQLTRRAMTDRDINQVAINRINSIKAMIDEGADFNKTAPKFGDELGQLTLTAENEDLYSFGKVLKDLRKDEVSEVVFDAKGYYIFRCYDRSDKEVLLSYVFIGAKTLNDYIAEKEQGYKIWSLVN